jgi:hypothetical protein
MGLVFAFLPLAVLAQDAWTAPADCHEDHFVAMQVAIPAQSTQPTHEEGNATLGGAVERTDETQTVKSSTSSADELKVDDPIEQASIPAQSIQPTHEEGNATLGGAVERTDETQTVKSSTSSADELKVDDPIEQASIRA